MGTPYDDGPSYIDDDLDTIETPTTWKTKEGKLLEIAKMDDDHILNCLKMLESNTIKRWRELKSVDVGNGDAFDACFPRPAELVSDVYWSFKKEVAKRNLKFKSRIQFNKPYASGIERLLEKLEK